MNYDQTKEVKQAFTQFLQDKQYSLGELYTASHNLLQNPHRSDMIKIYSDWQGHAAIAMKRAVFTLTSITLIQLFVLGNAFELQTAWLTGELSNEAHIRLKVAFTSSILLSLVLYLAAIKRDKRIRDCRFSLLKLVLEEFGEKYIHLRQLFSKFANEYKEQISDEDFHRVVFSIPPQDENNKRFREAMSEFIAYDKGVRPNSKMQMILDSYDTWVVPALSLISIALVWWS